VAYHPRSKHQRRTILRSVLLLAAATALTACGTPVGTPPSWRNLPLPPTQVTNPDGGGPQVTRWGPPDTSTTGRGR
jgi:predicted small lipoprotein YifL